MKSVKGTIHKIDEPVDRLVAFKVVETVDAVVSGTFVTELHVDVYNAVRVAVLEAL